jgi:hypothetical protein
MNYFTYKEIDDEIFNFINNRSYKKNNDISLYDLRYVSILYYDFNHDVKEGNLIVNKLIVEDVIYIFKELYNNEYELYSVKLVDNFYDEDNVIMDLNSMRANNTSCFNYRTVPGEKRLSNHALALAIDINPLNNPYVRNINGKLDYDNLTEEELKYVNNRHLKHCIDHNDLAFKLFNERGFEWGGDWDFKTQAIDYQHFEKHFDNYN